jgi:integrating conjugative element protein (TIGR03749 family)
MRLVLASVFVVGLIESLTCVYAETTNANVMAKPTTTTTSVSSAPGVIEQLHWTGTPMPLTLPVNGDRVVRFPTEVRIGPPGKLNEVLQTTSADGAVYFRALQAFAPSLVLVQETQAPGRTFALQLSAESGASSTPVEIVAPTDNSPSKVSVPDASADLIDESPPKRLGVMALTRYAAQQVYAPARLRHEVEGLYQTPVPVHRAVPLIRTAVMAGDIEATPIASWSEDSGLFVTAVKLQNKSPQAIELDPRTALRGHWLTATFQHYRLLPAGHEADTTTVYLVSNQAFVEALGIPRTHR